MKNEKIFSPLAGQIIQIEQVSDPVFAEKMLGDGIAVRPSITKHDIVAPCDGIIQTVHASKHAVAILCDGGYEVLIHTGVDTVSLEGKGFESFVSAGQKIKKGDKLLSVDFDFISKNAPSYDVIMIVTNMTEETALIKNMSNNINAGEEIFEISKKGSSEPDKKEEISSGFFSKLFGAKKDSKKEEPISSKSVSPESASTNSGELTSEVVNVINHTGIHARPASRIFQIAGKYKSKIEIKSGDKKANAKSIVAILGLGIKFNDPIQVVANGEDAKEAIAEIIVNIKDGLGEGGLQPSVVAKVTPEHKKEETIVSDFSFDVTLKGVLASPGLIIGKSFSIVEEAITVVENAKDISAEEKLLETSIADTKVKLTKDIAEAKELKQTTKVEVYSAHLTMLDDPTLFDFASDLIKKGKSAGFAWKSSVKNSVEILNSTGDALLIERIADLKDLERRVLYNILGMEVKSASYPKDSVIIAEDLVPSDLAQFDENVKGVVLALGSATSHVALILRNMGVPALVAVGKSILNVTNGAAIILDSNDGTLSINPDPKKLESIKVKQEKLESIKNENIANAKKPATTLDGHKIFVKGNVSNGNETEKAFELGGEGVGLLRTEFLFFNTPTEPSIEDQHGLYQYAVDAMQGGSVTLRTLDVGGDKPLAFVKIGAEENPIMGLRGVRNYFNNLDVFLNQIRAILKVKPLVLCKIMIPMVAEVNEVIKIREIIENEMKAQGIKDKVEIGTMIEVPSAALIADKIAKYVDFFSIGTNDLAQYTLAMDRGNHNLTSRLKNLNPSLLKLIKMTVDGGLKHNKPTAVCGAMASEVHSVPILIGLGITELSTSMRSIPDVKALIRTLDYKKCVEVANKALDMETSEEVIELVNKEFFNK